MAKYTNLKDLFTAIADAIRAKTGSTGTIVADDFPSAIEAMEIGSTQGEDAIVAGNRDGTFYSYVNNRVKRLRNEIFSEYHSLRTVECSEVTSVGVKAFHDCYNLSSVIMPKLSLIETGCFDSCRRLKRIDMDGGVGGAGGIMADSFLGTDLDTLIIRTESGVAELYGYAFGYPEFLEEACPIGLGTGYIYVPRSMVDQYKAANNWSTFAAQFRALEDYTVDGTITGELDESRT